jgi:hypothetical protein
MTKPEELGQAAECEQSASSVSDLCKTEYWNARSLWQSDLDYFAVEGIRGLDLANPDMVLKAGIILKTMATRLSLNTTPIPMKAETHLFCRLKVLPASQT